MHFDSFQYRRRRVGERVVLALDLTTHRVAADGLLSRTQVDGRVKAVYALRLDAVLVRLKSVP
jgi:hypothetical protein